MKIALLLLAACFALSLSLPAHRQQDSETHPLSPEHETARVLWSRAKRVYKDLMKKHVPKVKRTVSKRQAAGGSSTLENADAALANVTGPKYIKDLYLSNTTSSQANTIRSLKYTETVPTCGEYNFTLSGIHHNEYILKAELHLWLKVQLPMERNSYIVGINPVDADGTVYSRIMRLLQPKTSDDGMSDGYYVQFDVNELLKEFIDAEKTSILFRVNIYKDPDAFSAKQSYNCGHNVKFLYEGFTDLNMPLLIAYSYDPRVANVDYENIRAIAKASSQQGQVVTNTPQRRKRNPSTGLCQKHKLTVMASEIFIGIFSDDLSNQIVWPPDYDAGICGGNCINDDTLPAGHTNHAPFINILISTDTFDSRHSNYAFTSCCAPVRYSPLRVYVQDLTGSTTIVTIDDMIIDQCNCIDIL